MVGSDTQRKGSGHKLESRKFNLNRRKNFFGSSRDPFQSLQFCGCAFYAKYKTELVFISADGEFLEGKPEGLFMMLCFFKAFQVLLESSFFLVWKQPWGFCVGIKLTFLGSTAKVCCGLASPNPLVAVCFVCERRGFSSYIFVCR